MRRGRIITGFTLLIALACLMGATGALAATPQDICNDLKDGKVDGTYTAAEWTAFFADPTIQGYGCGGAIVAPSTPAPVTPAPSAPGAAPVTPAPIAPGTAPVVPLTPAGGTAPTVVSAVKGARATIASTPAPQATVKGARHTVQAPVSRSAAPLAATKARGTLPFTGAQLTLFALVGLALVATGLLLRSTARQGKRQ